MNLRDTGPVPAVIGIDLDNTLVIYDHLLHRLAVERGFIGPSVKKSKKEVRDTLRNLPDGEIEWQKLQGVMYGPRMNEASLGPNVAAFFRLCHEHGAKLHIISHKTEFANYDETRTNLRETAMQWMADHRFFDTSGLGLSREDVTFVGTRREKSERVQKLGCTHFVDDLEEVFQEPSFPPDVQKILFAPQGDTSSASGVTVAATWDQVGEYVFPHGN